jgi:hypothetical protein
MTCLVIHTVHGCCSLYKLPTTHSSCKECVIQVA